MGKAIENNPGFILIFSVVVVLVVVMVFVVVVERIAGSRHGRGRFKRPIFGVVCVYSFCEVRSTPRGDNGWPNAFDELTHAIVGRAGTLAVAAIVGFEQPGLGHHRSSPNVFD